MAISEYATISAVTVGTTELSVVTGTTTLASETSDGVYMLFVDASNMAKSDDYIIRVYEKVISTSTKRVVMEWAISGVQSTVFVAPSLILLHGWDFTIQKESGTDRAFDASIRKIG
jgi:hypothetical protein